jgi:hypothetical protein
MEDLLACDFADVRVHVGPEAPALGAWAFATGDSLFFAPGAYRPDTLRGLRLLAHELCHVAQQRAGCVSNLLGSGCAAVVDPRLEREADRVAAQVTGPSGRPRKAVPRTRPPGDGGRGTGGRVIQFQKWGLVGQRLIASGAPVEGPFDHLDDLKPSQLQELNRLGTNGGGGETGKARPAPADRYVRYRSAKALNEVYDNRREAWDRARELAAEAARVPVLWPAIVYLIGAHATAPVTPDGARTLCEGAMGGPLDHHFGRTWVRFRYRPDEGWQGFYYEFEPWCRGGALLLVEHVQDPQAELTVRRVGREGQDKYLSPVKHFHVAFYRREAEGSGVTYLPINHHGKTLQHGRYTINETQVLQTKKKYEVRFLPEHHIYYLND